MFRDPLGDILEAFAGPGGSLVRFWEPFELDLVTFRLHLVTLGCRFGGMKAVCILIICFAFCGKMENV